MPFTVALKGWLQVNNCLLCPETILIPPRTMIRFEYDDPNVQHYYKVTTIIDGVEIPFVLSRNFNAFNNGIDGSQNVQYRTGGLLNVDQSNVMGWVTEV